MFGEYADALLAHAHAGLGTAPGGTHFDTVVMGWNTLKGALEVGIASPYSHLRQIVATRSHRDPAVELNPDPLGGTVRW